MPKKDAEKSQSEKDAGTEVSVTDGSGDQPAADFEKHSQGVEGPDVHEGPSEDEPHGHPFQPTSAEPLLVTHGGDSDEARSQMAKSQRDAGSMVKISESEAYDDPEFNPVANADVPGHKGGPQAEGGSERAVGVVESDTDENEEALDYNWKNPDEQPK